VLMATKQGSSKKTTSCPTAIRGRGIIALSLDEKDQLISACLTDGTKEILLSSREGKAIHFVEDDVRDMGRTARGVRGITLGKNDSLVSMDILSPGTVGSSSCR